MQPDHPSNAGAQKEKRLDFTQRIEKKLAEYNTSRNVFKRWLFEILSWLVSALCMAAIVAIYDNIEGRSVYKTANLLTCTNMLGKVASAALIVPTTEAIGQLKWNWFHKSKAMWDFEIFDKASRGPLGAVMLLFRTKGRSLAALGALLIVLLLAIDTFFQQVVAMPQFWVLAAKSSHIPRTIWYEPGIDTVYTGGVMTAADMKDLSGTIEKFVFGNGSQPIPSGGGIRPDIPMTCPTNRCTWPIHDTLGVCSQCIDVSEIVQYACQNANIDWTVSLQGGNVPFQHNATMCGYFLNVTSKSPVFMSGSLVNKNGSLGETLLSRILPLNTFYDLTPLYGSGSIHFSSLRHRIADVLIASAAAGSDASITQQKRPVVQECSLSWCVKTIQSSYLSGAYVEKVLKVTQNVTEGHSPWLSVSNTTNGSNLTVVYYNEDVVIRKSDHNQTLGENSFGTSNATASNTFLAFRDSFPSFTTWNPQTNNTMMRWKTWKSGPAWQRKLNFNPWLAPNNISQHMDRLATAMTNVVRSAPSNEMLNGMSFETETSVQIRWAWLSFPFTLLILSLIFLVATIMKTSGDESIELWKTSAMPTLINSLPREVQSRFTSSSAWKSSTGASRKTGIRLTPQGGWRVSGQSFSDHSPRVPDDGGLARNGI